MEIARKVASSDRSSTPLTLHISVYVTCLCNPEAVPLIPNCDVTILRPNVHHILNDLVTPPTLSSLSPRSPSPEKLTSSSSSINENQPSSTVPTSPAPSPSDEDDDQEIVVVAEHGHVTTARGEVDVESADGLDPHVSRKLPWLGDGGGVAVCASGPASLMREAANAVTRLRLSKRGLEMGGVDIHTEVFSL